MSKSQDVVRRVEDADLQELGDLSVEDVYEHIDALTKQRPGPVDLYRRWERQHWAASEIDFSVDQQHWSVFDAFTKENLEQFFSGFFVGEQAVTDTLAPLVMGAPDEDSRLFLSTQLVDEARHSFFFARFYQEVIGVPGGIAEALSYARPWTNTTPYIQIFEKDLVQLTDDARLDPSDRRAWVKGITLYHMLVEGMLALTGQRMLLQILRTSNILPGFRQGFTAVTRDESRHVNFAVWALARSVSEGHEEAIREVMDLSLEACLRIYCNPEYKIFIPAGMPAELRSDPRHDWGFAIDSLTKRLRSAGVDAAYLDHLRETSWQHLWKAVAEYEDRWRDEHPVRQWERGEVGVGS